MDEFAETIFANVSQAGQIWHHFLSWWSRKDDGKPKHPHSPHVFTAHAFARRTPHAARPSLPAPTRSGCRNAG